MKTYIDPVLDLVFLPSFRRENKKLLQELDQKLTYKVVIWCSKGYGRNVYILLR